MAAFDLAPSCRPNQRFLKFLDSPKRQNFQRRYLQAIIVQQNRKQYIIQVKFRNASQGGFILKNGKRELSSGQREELLGLLKNRFEKNMNRHKGLEWNKVQAKLEANSEKLWSINEMEKTGGEPDVVSYDKKTGEFVFYDCSEETPSGRRNVCYDREALDSRKEHKPKNNAIDMADAIGIELLAEEQYRELQKLGDCDLKTSSWIKTPSGIRDLGGALYADRRYDRVFVYHNSAPSYYGVRGFRGSLKV